MIQEKLLKDVSKTLNLSRAEVLEESISSFLDRELRNASAEIEKLRKKYGVETHRELEDKIKKGAVKEHPAWEELIEWENLEQRIDEVLKWRKKIYISA